MARMMPSYIDDFAPPGERAVFGMLSGGPEDWTVLHSLDLAPWNRWLRTEIDFVVIVPDTGIVCIEVKSHMEIGYDGCTWTPEDIRRSPFKQASDARHSFYRKLRDLAPQYRHTPVVHFCIFPNAFFVISPNMSVHEWELMDSRVFRCFRTSGDFCQDLKRRMVCGIEADNLSMPETPMSAHAVDEIIRFCIPVQRRKPDSREVIRHREQELDSLLSEQQKPVFRLAGYNDRIVVSGGAGTGKSLIAFELARRYAESGERVALLCFNRLFGNWSSRKMEAFEPKLPNLLVGRVFQVLAGMMDIRIPEHPDRNYWNSELPELIEERLTDPDMRAMSRFDRVIVDEAQDLLARPVLLNCLYAFLEGGVSDGKYALFGDFRNQVLASRYALEQSMARILVEARPARWHLDENCRNYRIVARTSLGLSGLDEDIYSFFLRSGGSQENFDFDFYADDKQQASILDSWLKDFRRKGYRPEEITILSFLSDDNSLVGTGLLQGWHLEPLEQEANATHFGSVHAFKGLENKIIILTDVKLSENGFQRDLFYTGMTRATEYIRILFHESSKDILSCWMNNKMRKKA